MDARPGDHQPDLDDPLPDHPRQLRLRVRAGVSAQGSAGWSPLPFAINLVANLLFMPIFAGLRNVPLGGGGHRDRVGDDHLVRDRRLAALPLGRRGPGAVFRVGVHRHGAATVDHGDELGEAMIRLGLCCMFRDQPIKFVTTTATAIGKMKRPDALAKLSRPLPGERRRPAGLRSGSAPTTASAAFASTARFFRSRRIRPADTRSMICPKATRSFAGSRRAASSSKQAQSANLLSPRSVRGAELAAARSG